MMEIMPETDWDTIEKDIDRFVRESKEPFAPTTLANTQDLIKVCRACHVLPSVSKGYWSTVCFSWAGFQIEVFDESFEVYHFNRGKGLDVWYEEHRPGEPFSNKFLDELKAASSEAV
jgi:hypothetical protein